MDNRQKLVELLREVQYLGGLEEKIADHLIAHGVTVQDVPDNNVGKWISVKDRLPEEFTNVFVCDVREDYVAEWEYRRNGIWNNEGFSFYNSDLTHWMPLPQPPKGE